MVYVEFDGEPLIAASANGLPRHPAWYLNLRRMDVLTVDLATDAGVATVRATPSELIGDERRRAWEHLVSVHPRFVGHERRTRGVREIPLLALHVAPAG